ncbi:hypothetical protein [Phytohabitans rumicis]|nr:hypothetical protein [Phytohabitans rumicis]
MGDAGARDVEVEIDVDRLVAHACRLVRDDPLLLHRFEPRRPDALAAELGRFVSETLARHGVRAAARFAGYVRRCRLSPEDYDRFGHYLLTAALVCRVGPERLVLIGAALTTLRLVAVDGAR